MTETVEIEVPRRGIGSDLTEALAACGLRTELIETDDGCTLRVRFTDDEGERLLAQSIRVVEQYLSDRMLPLVVQRGNGGCIVRPPAD
ncbi:MAG: hypothetical protein WAU41_10105 [Gaiellaceae bacterium]